MQQRAIIFIGSQGSGKGTQADLLKKYLEENDSERGVFMFDTGTFLRGLAAGDTYTADRMRDSIEKGNLQPSFLAVYAWTKTLIEEFNGTDHLIIQGSPRSMMESEVMDPLFSFFGMDTTFVYLNVSEEAARERLMGRGRNDDTEEAISRRLSWFKDTVLPVVEKYKKDPDFEVIEVDADKSIEEVYEEMISKFVK